MANRWGNNGNSERLYFLGLQNHCRWWLQPWNWKMLSSWKKSYDQPRKHIKKQRNYFANKDLSSQSNSVQFISVAQSCLTLCNPCIAAHQASLSITNYQNLLKLMSIEEMMPSTISSSVILFSSCLQSFPPSGSFLMSQFFASSDQMHSASASILPMNIQDWFPLWLTGLISLLSKRLSKVFSSTTVQKHQFFGTQPSLWSNSHIHTWLLEKK